MSTHTAIKSNQEYGDIDPTVRGGYDFLDASHMLAGDTAPRPPPHVATAARQALARAGVLRATSVRVQHCAHAYALVLTVAASAAAKAASKATSKASAAKAESNTGGAGVAMQGIRGTGKDWKLVYSGDCRPSEALVREGKGAAVLIHEATFDESKQQVPARGIHRVDCVCVCVCILYVASVLFGRRVVHL